MLRLKQIYDLYPFDFTDEQVKADTAALLSEHSQDNNTPEVRQQIISMIDLTSLNSTDNEVTIERLVERANVVEPAVAGICVYPAMIETVKAHLTRPETKIVSVAASFPHAQTFIEVKIAEVSLAVAAGADETDIVIPLGKFLNGNHSEAFDEIVELKAAARTAKLKVILETGLLRSMKEVKQAALLSMAAGADFIKTSTGKATVSATPEAFYVMCQAVKEFYEKSGIRVGVKAAGGISTPEQAIQYYTIVKEVLGPEWLTPALFRFGATRLLDRLA